MLLSKKEIQKIAMEILAAAPSVTIRGDVNKTIVGGRGGGRISLTPGVANPMGMQVGTQPKAALPVGESNAKSPGKA